MARIIADSPEGQLVRVRAWLADRGGRWTRWLAMAIFEPFSASEAGWNAQVQQLDFVSGLGEPRVPAETAAAVGSMEDLLLSVLGGGALEVPEPSAALGEAVRQKYLQRRRDRVPPPPLPLPSGGRQWRIVKAVLIGAAAVWVANSVRR